mgnify:FL=1
MKRTKKCFPFHQCIFLKPILWLGLLGISQTYTLCQPASLTLTLEDVIRIAKDSSLQAFINQNMYLGDYWSYRTYQAELRPSLNLSSNPFNYTRAINEEYNFLDSTYQYIKQENVNSTVNLTLRQNISRTGGNIYVDSDLGRIQNFNKNFTQYSSTPLRIGLSQGLFAFNPYKWKKRLEPLKFEMAKKDYIESAEEIAVRAVNHYFSLLSAQINLEIAENNFANADTLYQISKKRFKLTTISQEDLFTLELDLINATNQLEAARNQFKRAQTRLLSFLRMDDSLQVQLDIPGKVPDYDINPSLALEKAMDNNPVNMQHEIELLQAQREVERAQKSRFDIDLNMSFGLNQNDDDIQGTYTNLLDQERVRLSLYIPIVDWGLAKGKYNLAVMQREVLEAQLEQADIDFRQDIIMTVEEFNNQHEIIKRAARADTLARKTYAITKKRFLIGKAGIVKLNANEQKMITARRNYLNALNNFWEYYYNLRQLTLYNFESNQSLGEDFDEAFKLE